MFLLIEVIIVAILFLVLMTIYAEERRTKDQNIPTGQIKEYWNGSERRKYVRVKKEFPVKYSVGKESQLLKSGVTKNISAGGILLETSEKLHLETNLGLTINIPNLQKPINANGLVVWVKDSPKTDQTGKRFFDTGIKFLNLEPEKKDALLQYIWAQ